MTTDDGVTPEELAEFHALKAELLSRDDVQAGLDKELNVMAERMVLHAIAVGRAIKRIEDPLTAIRLMAEVSVWWAELRKQTTKEVRKLSRPTNTVGSFKR